MMLCVSMLPSVDIANTLWCRGVAFGPCLVVRTMSFAIPSRVALCLAVPSVSSAGCPSHEAHDPSTPAVRRSATLDALTQLVTATAEAALPDGAVGMRIDAGAWRLAEGLVKLAVLGLDMALPVHVQGYRVRWAEFVDALRIGTDDVMGAAVEVRPFRCRPTAATSTLSPYGAPSPLPSSSSSSLRDCST